MSLAKTSAIAVAALALPYFAAAQEKGDPAAVPRMSQAEFKKLLAEDKVLVLDVRSEDAYRAGHVPGAVSAPFLKLEERLEPIKAAKKPIVAYCT